MKRQILLFLSTLIFCSLSAYAQQRLTFRVADFHHDQMDMTARNEQYKRTDDSGDMYAIIKVRSDRDDDDLAAYRFDFGLMNSFIELHEAEDELWVYVQRNTKTVTISREGYKTVSKYDLRTTITAGATYSMLISASAPVVYTQMVEFRVNPPTAKAMISVRSDRPDAIDEPLGIVDENGAVARALPFGTYTYHILAQDYYPSEGMFTLNNRNENHVEQVTLRGNFGTVTLTVDSDADIYVDGERKGRRSWTGILRGGSHQVECRQQSHRPAQQSITVAEGETANITLPQPTPITGTLSITSRPLGATIKIDSRDYGQTPRNITDLIVGHHKVELSATGRKGGSKEFDIQENQTTIIDLALEEMVIPVAPPPTPRNATPSTPSASLDSLGLCPDANHPHMIDMGTGVKFACCNVGAHSPIEYGDYFAWGETKVKNTYNWRKYKYSRGRADKLTKYCNNREGTADNKTQLELSDDAARANWGGTWRMPTIDELSQLNSSCTWTWTRIGGVNGYKVTASNGNTLFFPAAGFRSEKSRFDTGSDGRYWSSSLGNSYTGWAHEYYFSSNARTLNFNMFFSKSNHTMFNAERDIGQSVRAVTD